MAFETAARTDRVEPSPTLAVSNRANELEDEGVDVIDLSVGEPDFRTPANVVEAGKAALDAGHHGYTSSNGIPELREAISEAFTADGLEYGPEEIIVTPGGKQALYEVITATVDPGDEVVLIDPAWVSYEPMVKLAGGTVTRVDTTSHWFQLEPALDDLAAAVTDETALLVVNSPNNPTGAVYSRAALEGVRDLAVEHDVPVIADEIYNAIRYQEDCPSLGALEGMGDRTITVNGFSKAYAMTGWRLGYVGAPERVHTAAGRIHSHSVTCAANFVQRAGIEALRHTDERVAEMVDAFEERRDLLIDLLRDHDVEIDPPMGAFYLMLPVPEDDAAWADRAIEEAHVATVPGHAFNAPGYVRVSYANGADRIREGIDRLAEADLL